MVARLDIHYRIDPSNNTLRVRYDPGGAGDTGYVDLTLTTGLYSSLSALCQEVTTQMQTVNANLQASESSGVVYLESDNTTWEVVWTALPLMRWLGFSSNLGGDWEYLGTLSPGTFIATLPWDSDHPVGWEWTIKRWISHDQTGGSLKVGKLRLFHTRAQVTRDELDHFRGVLSMLLKGYPARWWRDTSVSSAWSYSDPTWKGYLDVTLAPSVRGYGEQWANEQVLRYLSVDLDFTEHS